jgi:Tol biopolymer transport system component
MRSAAEVESLLRFDTETAESVRHRVAAAAAHVLGDDASRGRHQGMTTARHADSPTMPSDIGEGRFPPGTLLGRRYRIVSLLGRGGMGEVYRATDLALRQPVALKFLPDTAANDPRMPSRLLGEVRLARQISHPNVCRVYDIGEVDGAAFISMQYIDGEDLASLLRRIGRLPYEKALEIARRLCAGLAAAHDTGVVHRDLKPANIMVDGRGQVFITDFGLAATARGLARAEVCSGTPAYMAPEQLRGQEVSTRSDVYALGLVLYEMFTGRRPFDRARQPADQPPSLSGAAEELDPAVARAIERCITLDPRDRPESAAAVAASLPAGNPPADALAGPIPSPQPRAAASAPRQVAQQAQHSSSSDAQIVAALVKRHRGAAVVAALMLALPLFGAAYLVTSRPTPDRLDATAQVPSVGDYQISQLTTSGSVVNPAIAPDGRYVVYLRQEGEGFSLWVRQIATPSNVRIVEAEPGVRLDGPTVTPDGSFIDFIRLSSREGSGLLPGLWRVPFLGGTPRRLVENVWSPIEWSPDGRQMAFVRINLADNSTALVVADADGGRERVLSTRQRPASFIGLFADGVNVRPAWSPDGRLIALFADDGFQLQVVFVDAGSGSELAALDAHGSLNPHGLTWLDSESLVLSQPAQEGGPIQLWRMSYPDGAVSRLTNDLSSYLGASLAADRSILVTLRSDTRAALWVGDASGTPGAEVGSPAPVAPVHISVAWAGPHVVYDTVFNGQPSIASVLPEASMSADVAPNARGAVATSDGRTIVFSKAGTPGLWAADADGRRARFLLFQDSVPSVISRDDRHIIFLSDHSGVQSPWMVPIEGGQPTEIVRRVAGNRTLDISPDGRRLLFLSSGAQNQWMIVTCDLPACSNRRTQDLPANFRWEWTRWTPDERAIAYVDATGNNIWAQPLDGGPPRQITRFGDRAIRGFAWSHDGKRLAVVRTTTTNDIVLLRGLKGQRVHGRAEHRLTADGR